MLQDSCLRSFRALDPLRDACVLIADISLNDALDSLDLVVPMVQAYNLADELCTLGNKALMDGLVDRFKSVPESLLEIADPMQLRVMRTHHSAVMAQQFFTRVTVVANGLAVQHASLILRNLWVERVKHSSSQLRSNATHCPEASCQVLSAIIDLTVHVNG